MHVAKGDLFTGFKIRVCERRPSSQQLLHVSPATLSVSATSVRLHRGGPSGSVGALALARVAQVLGAV